MNIAARIAMNIFHFFSGGVLTWKLPARDAVLKI